MVCKGDCIQYKAIKKYNGNLGRYAIGQKRCSTCDLFINWDGLWCPCCNRTLRTKPRNTLNRKHLQELNFVKRI
jgi:hypothetical protein